ncbi:NlpC/P60 family protein [Pontivivens ytuae]|uniref:C40 family peptidase n=1 Tax=Pontivivens ytuae TaxID=2789856 RepID=A0A7S9LV37_9RHOB|nr:NlpC/P60 family protein [Pontivivens ytuae]QPH55669.1 C40 family peptidase [Pontivivens ytuae]
MTFDPRMTPARRDLAAVHLKGEIEAPRYAEGREMHVAVPVLPMTSHPDPEAGFSSQLLMGERFTVYDVDDATGLAWGQAARDGYVGWVPRFALESGPGAPTHWVVAQLAHIYPEPNLKTRPFDAVPFLAQLRITGQEGRWLELDTGGWIYGRHVSEERPGGDWVGICERFLGVPYLWGGKSSLGLDCSALIQSGLHGAGLDCPRDSDQQEEALGRELKLDAKLKRGDIVFWNGHVGVMTSPKRLFHANAFAMAAVYEDIELARDRIDAQGDGPVTRIRRL